VEVLITNKKVKSVSINCRSALSVIEDIVKVATQCKSSFKNQYLHIHGLCVCVSFINGHVVIMNVPVIIN
jgi:hypothetical protein